MIQGLFTVAAAVIGGAVASFAVLLLTSSRVRKERAFDRSLEWCESMMRAINAVGAAVTTASTASDPGREACWTETIRLYEKLIPLCGLKDMYAPMNAIEAIDAFMRELDMLIESHLQSHRTSAPVNCDNCLAELRRAATSLARIGRGHLGLKRLPETMTDPSRRFLDTFRGRELGQHDDAFS